MSSYFYKGKNRAGKTVSGTLQVGNRQQAVKVLRGMGVVPMTLKEKGSKGGKGKSLFSFGKGGGKKKKGMTEAFLTKVLQLHKGGMPVGDAVKTLKERLNDPAEKELAQNIWTDLSEGQTLAGSMKKYPEVFDNAIVFAIEAGEASGNLAPILENIVESLHSQAELKKQVYAGLAYPIFVSCVALAVVALFLFYLLPRIESMMKSLGGGMTWSAKLLIGSADAAIYLGPIFVILGIVGVVFVKRYRETERGVLETDKWMLKIPMLSGVMQQATYAQVSNLLATLIGSGVNTTESMRLTEKLIKNTEMRNRFTASEKQINDGVALSKAFQVNEFFPDLAIDILSVGENTGDITHSFKEIYLIYREQLGKSLNRMTTLLSSAALMFAFMLVTLLAMSIVTSVLQLSNSLVK